MGLSDWIQVERRGVTVYWREWTCCDPSAVVVIPQGASTQSQRYARFADALNLAGFATLALGHRREWRTEGLDATGGSSGPKSLDLLEDLNDLLELATDRYPGLPVAMVGHSVAALATLAYASRNPGRLAAIVLSEFPVSSDALGDDVSSLGDIASKIANEAIDLLSEGNEPLDSARTLVDWLSSESDEVDLYLEDAVADRPLTFEVVTSLFGLLADLLQSDALSRVRCPVLMIASNSDRSADVCSRTMSCLASDFEAAGVQVTSRAYGKPNWSSAAKRESVTADVIDWLRRHVKT
jgi:alpha-beta hydrolase superfamily lysophospholipase